MPNCPNCGAVVYDWDKYCTNCGTSLVVPSQEGRSPSQSQPRDQPESVPPAPAEQSGRPESRPVRQPQGRPGETGRRDVLKLGMAGAIGAGVLGVGWLALEDDGEPSAVPGTDASTDTPTRTATPSGGSTVAADPIPMGSILPVTGALSDFGEAMQAAVDLAVEHVNDAGGPLDREIELYDRDSETSPNPAVQQYDELVESDIVGFVGAASSPVSMALARNAADGGVAQVSPSSTSPSLADVGWDGGTKYFGRTAPNDTQQGIAMAYVCDEVVGAGTAGFLYVDNAYGEALAAAAEAHFPGRTVASVGYDQRNDDYTPTLDALFADDPEVVGFVGYPNGGTSILRQWDAGGYGGEWVFGNGVNTRRFREAMDDEVGIAGFHLVSPDPEDTRGGERFRREFSGEPLPFVSNAYDALFLQALAIHRAGEATGTAIARNLRAVSRPPGETVTVGEFDLAKALLDDDASITYVGASSPLELTEALEPVVRYAVHRIRDGGSTTTVERLPRSYFDGRL